MIFLAGGASSDWVQTVGGWSSVAVILGFIGGILVWVIRQVRQRIYNVSLKAKACTQVVPGFCLDATNNAWIDIGVPHLGVQVDRGWLRRSPTLEIGHLASPPPPAPSVLAGRGKGIWQTFVKAEAVRTECKVTSGFIRFRFKPRGGPWISSNRCPI